MSCPDGWNSDCWKGDFASQNSELHLSRCVTMPEEPCLLLEPCIFGHTWRFPKIGVPLKSSILDWDFPFSINHHHWGSPMTMDTMESPTSCVPRDCRRSSPQILGPSVPDCPWRSAATSDSRSRP